MKTLKTLVLTVFMAIPGLSIAAAGNSCNVIVNNYKTDNESSVESVKFDFKNAYNNVQIGSKFQNKTSRAEMIKQLISAYDNKSKICVRWDKNNFIQEVYFDK